MTPPKNTTDEPVTRDGLDDYRRAIVTAAAKIKADRIPAYSHEIQLVQEAERYMNFDRKLAAVYADAFTQERLAIEARPSNRSSEQHDADAEALRVAHRALGVQQDQIANRLDKAFHSRDAMALSEATASALLAIAQELHLLNARLPSTWTST